LNCFKKTWQGELVLPSRGCLGVCSFSSCWKNICSEAK